MFHGQGAEWVAPAVQLSVVPQSATLVVPRPEQLLLAFHVQSAALLVSAPEHEREKPWPEQASYPPLLQSLLEEPAQAFVAGACCVNCGWRRAAGLIGNPRGGVVRPAAAAPTRRSPGR